MMQVHTYETIHSDMRDDDVDGLRLMLHKLGQQINGLIAENAQLRLELLIKDARGHYAGELGSSSNTPSEQPIALNPLASGDPVPAAG